MTDDNVREIAAWVALSRAELPGRQAMRLLEHFGGPEAVFEAGPVEIAEAVEISSAMLSRLLAQRPDREGMRDVEALGKLGASVVTIRDASYPTLLRQIADAPVVLYVQGELREEDNLAVGVVGSRRCSPYGRLVAHSLAGKLAERGLTVVSGLALGIDGAAHQGALEAGGRTIGVVACGLDIDYPREHRELREAIVRSGAIVSEVPLGTAPTPARFPVRNRIISGLSLGTVVVEAPEKSGALITARLAGEQGREVFAVPGNVNSYHARGCHQLLRDGAKLVESVDDILEELNLGIANAAAMAGQEASSCPTADRPAGAASFAKATEPKGTPSLQKKRREPREAAKPKRRKESARRSETRPKQSEESSSPTLPAGLQPEEEKLLAALSLQQKHVDDVIRETGLPTPQVTAGLMMLELKGLVRRLPGNLFVRVK